jgi:photosystem II stability/assembly factor-like uncharacterized protein
MRFHLLHPGTAAVAFSLTFLLSATDAPDTVRQTNAIRKQMPGDWFYRQRAYPQGFIDQQQRRASLEQARALKAQSARGTTAQWIQRGPSNIGGRITTMDISRQNPNILYVGAADGGVLKSTNAGVNWTPLFDDQPSLSMGAIAIDPTDDNIVYVGTGEANSSGDSYDGFGMVKSTNGGATWIHLGLEETRHIGKIVIDPTNTNVLYIAAMGTLFTGNPDRGVYKSTDGGLTWSHVLSINDSTGVVDLAINPQNPDILLAGAWQRMRGPQGRRYVGGIHTRIYRTTNAGASWHPLSGGLPAPANNVGRPAVAIAPSNPQIMYAAFADDPGNFMGSYKSTDGGDTWTRTNDGNLSGLYSNFGWYFGKVFINPHNPDNVFIHGVQMARTTNGGASWSTTTAVHVDHHAMAFHPTVANLMYIGTDGGHARSTNTGANWSREPNQDLFITQFYAGWISHLNPNASMGGTQDNGTPRTQTGSNSDWASINGGDGFYCIIDYTDANYQYAESQYGGIRRTINNWASSSSATSGISSSDRKNWSTPIIIDPNNPMILYTGTQRMYRTTNRAQSWTAISGDLSNGLVPGFTAYATITTIDVAKTDSNVIMAGTDDGNVWVTTNGGTNWIDIKAGLPNRWITRVRFDPTDHTIAYVTLSGYRIDSPLPHIFRTTNLGSTWQDISNNLPEAPINVVLVDPHHTDRLYIGTDVGCYFTTNTGTTWQTMGANLPNAAVSDMQLHAPTRIARAFTHGRSMWEINLDDLVVTNVAGQGEVPARFSLAQNYPNPFNPATTIAYEVPVQGTVTLIVYDAAGREVRTLVDGTIAAGSYSVTWDGRNQAGDLVASGVYLYRLVVGNEMKTRKMLLAR